MDLFPPSPGGGQSVDYGYKGKGVTLHMLSDSKGSPLSALHGSAKSDERKMVLPLIEKSNIFVLKDLSNLSQSMLFLEADKGYDAMWLRQELLKNQVLPLIPYRGKRDCIHRESCKFFQRTSVRWKIERSFAWMKRKCRRLLLKWERLAETWSAMIDLVLIYFWLKLLVR
jgi:transposase